MLTLATIQGAVCADVRENGRVVRAAMVRAAQGGARVAHFAEGALSGYVISEIADWAAVDWGALQEELAAVAALAGRLGMWVVLGANHRLPGGMWPHNSLYVISDAGRVVGRYDKRYCSNIELTYWYTPGGAPLVFDVDGVRFGCALCIEVVFPEVFAEYERLGAVVALLSSYSRDPVHGVMAQAHAGTNCMWVSVSTPAVCSRTLPAALFGPDGHPVGRCAAGAPGMVLAEVGLKGGVEAGRYGVALRLTRPWRALARSGQVHASRRASGVMQAGVMQAGVTRTGL